MPDWLPEMVAVDPWTTTTYDVLYEIFCRDIRDHDLKYLDYSVWMFPDMEDGKEKLFWHLTDREKKKKKVPRRKRKFQVEESNGQEERLPDPRRCERLPWVKPLVENALDGQVVAWDYEEGDKTIKTYVWLKEKGYVVIMKKYRDNTRRLITAFYIDKEYKKEDFRKKYKKRIV